LTASCLNSSLYRIPLPILFYLLWLSYIFYHKKRRVYSGRISAMSGDLRNFDLTVDEIKIVRMIKELIENLDRLSFDDPHSPKWVKYKFRLTRSQSRPI